jgi:hypothetical protein
MSVTSLESPPQRRALASQLLARLPVWFWVAAFAGVVVAANGNKLLFDPDTYWQIKVGQWILDHRAVPWVDVYSLTKAGTPWISSSWLAQVLFAGVYAQAGWNGVVWLTSLAIAATFGLQVHLLGRRLSPFYASFLAIVTLALTAHHLLARPHVLAMPFMVAWVSGLVIASDRGTKPSFWLLPLMVIWTNLHGGFVLGVALIGPIALDALWNAPAAQRKSLAIHWALFGLAALAASCLTPYGWHSLLASVKILNLGALLSLISEWMPVNFEHVSLFECYMLVLIAAALYLGVVLSPTRILLTLGLLHMGLSHVRSIEVFVLLLPLLLLEPLTRQFPALTVQARDTAGRVGRCGTVAAVLILAVIIGAGVTVRPIKPPLEETYEPAIAALKEHKAERVFNDYGFGGYMIWDDMRPFIDGRSELYGEKFGVDVLHAASLKNPEILFQLLSTYRIDAVLLMRDTAAGRLLDRLDGWTKVFSNDLAVVFVRAKPIGEGAERIKVD